MQWNYKIGNGKNNQKSEVLLKSIAQAIPSGVILPVGKRFDFWREI